MLIFFIYYCQRSPNEYQAYFQRVLSTRTVRQAQVLSVFGAFGCFLMAIPPALIAINALALPDDSHLKETIKHHTTLTLPLMLKYTTPTFIG